MNNFLIQEVERLCSAQIHDVKGLLASYLNWFHILKCRHDCTDLANKKITEYEELLGAYVQIRKMGRYPDIKKLKEMYLSPVEA